MSDSILRFDLVTAELRALGITLRRLPGEYCVNFRNGSDGTARLADDLDQALEIGRAMAADKAATRAAEKAPLRRKWRPKRMTAKAQRRRFIRRHNRRVGVRAMRMRHRKP